MTNAIPFTTPFTTPFATLLAPFPHLLLRPQILLMAAAVIGGIITLRINHLLHTGYPLITLLVLCGITRLISQVFYYFSSTSAWDVLPGARRSMATLLLVGCSLAALLSLAFVAHVFVSPSELDFMFPPLTLTVLFFAWGGIAKEPAIEVVQAINKPQWLPLFNIFNITVILAAAALTFAGQHEWIIALTLIALLANLAVALAGAFFMRQVRPRVSVPLPLLLSGVMRAPSTQSQSSGTAKILTARWSITPWHFLSERAWAKRFGRRLWFIDLITPSFLVIRLSLMGFMGALAAYYNDSSPPNSDPLNSPMLLMSAILMAHPLLLGSKSGQPWSFIASLPVSRPQLARDLTFRAMRVVLLDLLILTLLATAITWSMPYKQPPPRPMNVPPKVLAIYAKHPPIQGRTQITPWDIAAFASVAAAALAFARLMVMVDIPVANKPRSTSIPKLLLASFAFVALPIALSAASLEFTKSIPQPVTPIHWATLTLCTLLICACAFWLYYNLWRTAQFHDHGIQLSLKPALRASLGFKNNT